MSSHESPVNELDRPAKRRIQRRHGACEPCRSSKTKCDGRMPCGACRSERRRQCPCRYSEKAMKLQLVTAEIRRRAESEKRNNDDSLKHLSDDETRKHLYDDRHEPIAHNMSTDDTGELSSIRQDRDQACIEPDADSARMLHTVSVCAAVEEFKRLKTARGYSAQVIGKCDGFEVPENAAIHDKSRGVVQLSQTQSSPNSSPRSTNASPFSARVQAMRERLDAVDQLVRDGYLTRAWVDIASLVREGQLVHATFIDDESSLAASGWQRTWNSILDLEAQIGLTIGRPICVLFPKKTPLKSTNDTLSLEDTLDDTRMDLYQHIQGMLGLDFTASTAIRDFLERARDVIQHEPFNQVGLCTTEGHSPAVRDLHLNTHLFYMVIYCRMATLCDLFSRDLTNSSWSESPAADIIKSLNLHQPRQKLAYCRKMFRSANFILDSFMSLHHSDEEQTGKGWMRCHGAYIAAVILGIAKLRHEVEWHANTEKLKDIAQIFLELQKGNPHCQFFSTAVVRLHDLNSVKEPASEATRNKHTGVKLHKRSAPHSPQTSPREPHTRLPGTAPTSTRASPTMALKRSIAMVEGHDTDSDQSHEQFVHHNNVQESDEFQSQAAANQSYDDSHLSHLSLFEDNSATYSEPTRSFTNTSAGSSATSFCESDISMQAVSDLPFNHPGPPFAYPFPYNVFHPPMTWNNTMYHMPSHDNAPMPMQLTGIPQYGTDPPPMTNGLASQFGMQSASSIKPSTAHSLQSSPMQPSSGERLGHSKLSPPMQAASRYSNPSQLPVSMSRNDMGGQAFLQQVKTPVPSSDLPDHSRGPSLERGNPAHKLHPSSAMDQGDQQHSSVDWQPISAVAPARDIHSHLGGPMTVSRMDRRTSIDNNGHHGLQAQRQPPESCYPHPNVSSAPEMLGNQAYPSEQMAYLNPATGMFEQHHLHGQYQQNHLPTYTRYVVPDSGQFQEQWRRMSIDTGGPSGAPF